MHRGSSRDKENQSGNSRKSVTFDKPRLNKLVELKQKLNEIKDYEAKQLQSTNDLSQNSQQAINRAVSSKLNFHQKQPIFKNLPKIERELTANSLIERIQKANLTKNKKSQEVRDEVKDLIKKLVELEYENEEIDRKAEMRSLPSEDDYLKLSKFKKPNFYLPSWKKETEIFRDEAQEQLENSLFRCEDYLHRNQPVEITLPSVKLPANNCKCIDSLDYHNKRQSSCQ